MSRPYLYSYCGLSSIGGLKTSKTSVFEPDAFAVENRGGPLRSFSRYGFREFHSIRSGNFLSDIANTRIRLCVFSAFGFRLSETLAGYSADTTVSTPFFTRRSKDSIDVPSTNHYVSTAVRDCLLNTFIHLTHLFYGKKQFGHT